MTIGSYTVLICTRNRASTLASALASHLALEVPPGTTRDLIVVDNGSSDGTADVVAAFRQRAPFPVTYIREDREGHSVALNTGCRAAQGDVIVFTDDDAFPDPGWLAAIHDTFSRHGCEWVYGPVVPRWESGIAPSWYGRYTSQFVACIDYSPTEFIASAPAQHFAGVNHACLRERLFALGLYREDLGILPGRKGFAGNDDDLFARALAAGYRLVYNPDVRVTHLIAASRYPRSVWRALARQAGSNHFDHLLQHPPQIPTLLGVPRFYYRLPFIHLLGWAKGLLVNDPSLRFFSETQLIRFLTMIKCALAHRFTHGHLADRQGVPGR